MRKRRKRAAPDRPVAAPVGKQRELPATGKWTALRARFQAWVTRPHAEHDDGLTGLPEVVHGWAEGIFKFIDWLRGRGATHSKPVPGLLQASSLLRTASVAATIFLSYFALHFVMNEIEPFGLANATKAHSARISARVMAPFYGSDAQDHIAVVLIDDSTLKSRDMGWPPRYTYYEEVLRRILRQQPRAIYVDILLQDKRAYDGSLAEARTSLADDLVDAAVPVWFGVASAGDDSLFSGIAGVKSAVSSWQGVGSNYPLALSPDQVVHWRNAKHVVATHPAAAKHAADSVALVLYQSACRTQAPGCKEPASRLTQAMATVPMTVLWGDRLPVAVVGAGAALDCSASTRDSDSFTRKLGAALRSGWISLRSGADPQRLEQHRSRCPYTLTLREQQLDDPDTAALLKDRIVLIGTRLAGMDDSVYSPVHHRIPGVYLHAMALDNLMTWGRDRLHPNHHVARMAGALLTGLLPIVLAITLRYSHGRRRFAWLVGIGLIASLGVTAWLQVHYRLPPLDWIGGLALFSLIVLGIGRHHEKH